MSVPVGPGAASAQHAGGPDWIVEYAEGARRFRQMWEPREMGGSLLVLLDTWSEPPGEPTTREQRERITEGLWTAGRTIGVKAVLERRPEAFVVWHWDRGEHGFDVHIDHATVEYRELGRTLKLPFRADPADPFRRTVEPPADPCWTHPAGTAVTPAEWARIAENLRGAKVRVP